MTHTATLIPGDGIGPEVTAAAVRVLSATGVDFQWETENAGAQAAATEGKPLPERVLASIRRNRVALKGPTGTPVGGGHRSVNVELRRTLDLFANLRPAKSRPIPGSLQGVDMLMVRENTQGLYVEQVRAWRAACEQANARQEAEAANQAQRHKADKRRIKELERELHRKEKALVLPV